MSFNIADFNSKLSQHGGLSKSNLFFARINIPQALINEFVDIPVSRDLEFFCKSVTLPGFDLETADVQPQGFGPVVRRPQGMNFPVMPCIFFVDSNFGIMKFFHRWMQAVVNYDRSGGNFGAVNGALPFEMGYKSEYATTMDVAVFSQNSRRVEYVYNFSGLYPVNTGTQETDWSTQGEVMTMAVGFSYDQLKVTGSESGKVESENGSTAGRMLRWFNTINQTVNAIEAFRKPTDIQDSINNLQTVNTIYNSFK
jgi:hypothetical protein